MRASLVAVLALAACATPPPDIPPPPSPPPYEGRDNAGNRMEALIERDGQACTRDEAWCVTTEGEVVRVGLAQHWSIGGEGFANDENRGVWPFIVRNADDTEALAGVLTTQEQAYSGGGASATALALYRISLQDNSIPFQDDPVLVLTAPVSGDVMIRACFADADRRARRDACHDRYWFAAALALDESESEGPPRFLLTTHAWTYPGRRGRAEDSTQAPALSSRDLHWERDETCSYRRTLVYSEYAGGYTPDQPLPACSDYLEP